MLLSLGWSLLPLLLQAASFHEQPTPSSSAPASVKELSKALSNLNLSQPHSARSTTADEDEDSARSRYPEYSPNSRRKFSQSQAPSSMTKRKSGGLSGGISTPRALISQVTSSLQGKFQGKTSTGKSQKKQFMAEEGTGYEEMGQDLTSETDEYPLSPSRPESSSTTPEWQKREPNSPTTVETSSGITRSKRVTPPPMASDRSSSFGSRPNSARNSDSSSNSSATGTPTPKRKSAKTVPNMLQAALSNLSNRSSSGSSPPPPLSKRDTPVDFIFPGPPLKLASQRVTASPNTSNPPSTLTTPHNSSSAEEAPMVVEGLLDNFEAALFLPFLEANGGEEGVGQDGYPTFALPRLFMAIAKHPKPPSEVAFTLCLCLPFYLSHPRILGLFKTAHEASLPSLNQLWSIYVALYYQPVEWPHSLQVPATFDGLLGRLRSPFQSRGQAALLLSRVDPLPSLVDDEFLTPLVTSRPEHWIEGLVEYYRFLRAELHPTDLIHSLLLPDKAMAPFTLIRDLSNQVSHADSNHLDLD